MDILSLGVWCLARSPNKFPKCQTVFSQIFNDVAGTALSPSGSQIGNAQRLLVVPHRSIPAEQNRQNRMRETVCVAPNAGVVVESLLVTHTEQKKNRVRYKQIGISRLYNTPDRVLCILFLHFITVSLVLYVLCLYYHIISNDFSSSMYVFYMFTFSFFVVFIFFTSRELDRNQRNTITN